MRICLLLVFMMIGIFTKAQVPPDADSTVILEKVEMEASFPGGAKAWVMYLQKNLNGNIPVNRKAPAGIYRVVIRFIVAKDGSLSGIKAETNHGYGMEEEVIRIIAKGPKWNPAFQHGRVVNAYRRQPVSFMVN